MPKHRSDTSRSSLGKLSRTADFKHFLWKRHDDPRAYSDSLPEIVASDGNFVRRMASQHRQIIFQIFDDRHTAMQIVSRIESSIGRGVALLGYSMFADRKAVAILHTGDGLEPGWIAYSYQSADRSQLPTLPMRLVDSPQARLVAGAKLKWDQGAPVLRAALEQRGSEFLASPHRFSLLDHLVSWEVRARTESREIRLARKNTTPSLERVDECRLHARFELDEVLYNEFKDDPTFRIWFLLTFDDEMFCLPRDWRTFWLSVDVAS